MKGLCRYALPAFVDGFLSLPKHAGVPGEVGKIMSMYIYIYIYIHICVYITFRFYHSGLGSTPNP